MKIHEMDLYLRELFQPHFYKDYCPNGLVVDAERELEKVVTGVSFSDALIEDAISLKAQALIVHHPHGFWNKESHTLTGNLGKRVRKLIREGISLWAFHLPMDGHLEVGNNAGIAQALGAQRERGFMREGQADVACIARFLTPMDALELQERVCALFGERTIRCLYGKTAVERIGICSGGGASGLEEALSLGADAYITGEIKESHPMMAKEESFHLFAGGHYATEVFGPRLLAERLQKDLLLPCQFVDIPVSV